jgi:hypothetical protein
MVVGSCLIKFRVEEVEFRPLRNPPSLLFNDRLRPFLLEGKAARVESDYRLL